MESQFSFVAHILKFSLVNHDESVAYFGHKWIAYKMVVGFHPLTNPIVSMYSLFSCIWLVLWYGSKYTIHGSFGNSIWRCLKKDIGMPVCFPWSIPGTRAQFLDCVQQHCQNRHFKTLPGAHEDGFPGSTWFVRQRDHHVPERAGSQVARTPSNLHLHH